MDTLYLVLENNMIFQGNAFGAQGEITGEIVFTTGMTGYLETLTDLSYYGQIIVQTFSLIGNYGVIPQDFESEKIRARAYIVNSWCEAPSNYRSVGNVDAFLKQNNVIGLCNVDTRALTKVIRSFGVLKGRITKDPLKVAMEEIKNYEIKDAVKAVSCKTMHSYKAANSKYKIALMDFGLKENIKKELLIRDADVVVLPYNATYEEIKQLNPHGIMLSNGPGNPAENTEIIENLKKIIELDIPIFAICLGHQLLALAHGFKTQKLKYGHRGANQPAKDNLSKQIYITSQNHGYAVVTESIDKSIAHEWFTNVNDNTCEGIIYKNSPIASVQFHPEACGGPKDTAFLFEKFLKMAEEYKNACKQ